MWTGWIECRCDTHWSRCMSNNYITQYYRKFKLAGDQSLESVVAVRGSENQTQQRAGPSGPRGSSPAGWERSATIARRVGGQYVAVFVQSLTHLSHITLCKPFVPFRIKCERFIFLKNCVSFVIIVLTMFLHAYEYVTQ